jgi:hypothetical protein
VSGIIDFAACIRDWLKSPYLSGPMGKAFVGIATGKQGVVERSAFADFDTSLFAGDTALFDFYQAYLRHNLGTFNQHFAASIPYVIQEECRLGAAMLAMLKQISDAEKRPVALHTVGNAEGVIARTIAHLGAGRIHTLTDSVTGPNEADFNLAKPPTSRFFHGPFFDITPEKLKAMGEPFASGADIIYEDTLFQMIAPNRKEQVACLVERRMLKEDGLLVLMEKCTTDDPEDYIAREDQKDGGFKGLYFAMEEITAKRSSILQHMQGGQVKLEELAEGIAHTLPHVAVTWNSGNFHVLVAGKNPRRVAEFCRLMTPPCIPAEYIYMPLPHVSAGLEGTRLSFRQPRRTADPVARPGQEKKAAL